MPINRRHTAEPSPGGGSPLPTVLAECDASRLLQVELERYCDDRVRGRSILIAGYRGTGKTMMVDHALMQIINRTREGAEPRMRPLPVMLLAPSLLPNPRAIGPVAAPPPPAGSSPIAVNVQMNPLPAPRPPSEPPEGEKLRRALLEAVVLGLHAALSREVVRCVRLATEGSADGMQSTAGELAAQLEIELTEGPLPSRLREFWKLAGALQFGLLFPHRFRAGSGMRELAAVTGVGYAYQRVSGELKERNEEKAVTTLQRESGTGWDLKLVEAFKPFVAVASGAVVAAGASAGGAREDSLVMGLAAALFAGAFFRITRTSALRRERQIDRTFLPDTRAETLDRVLPSLIQRLKSAGLAPVFIVDELDKVDDLWMRITPLLDHFKKLFAEGAFTCLIVNRDFSEGLRILQAVDPYGRQSSYFSHRLFVSYEPAALHDYLDDILEVEHG